MICTQRTKIRFISRVLFIKKAGNAILIKQIWILIILITYTLHHCTRQFSFVSALKYPQFSFAQHLHQLTKRLSFAVLPTTPAIILCVTSPSTIPEIILCRSFLPQYLHPLSRQLSSFGLFFSFHPRPNVVGRHYISAPNLKGIFYVCYDRYHSGSIQITCGEFNLR